MSSIRPLRALVLGANLTVLALEGYAIKLADDTVYSLLD
jgi:hypothetical protein